MRVLSVFVSVLLAANAWAQAPAAVYTPSQRDLDVPTYVNATVVRADTRTNTITFRSESGEVMLAAEGEALARLGRLRPGDEVLLGYRVDDRTGRPVHVVTAILSGDELAARAQSATPSTVAVPSATVVGLRNVTTFTNTGTLDAGSVATTSAGAVGVIPGTTGTVSTPGFSIINQPASPFASVIPSLPSTVGTLNVVLPPASAPALAELYPVGALREVATRDYDNAVRTLAMKANEIDMQWFRYRDSCLTPSSTDAGLLGANRDREWFMLFDEGERTSADDNCRQLRVEMNGMAMDWRDLMTRSEETARRHDVLPGALRDIRARYRVEF